MNQINRRLRQMGVGAVCAGLLLGAGTAHAEDICLSAFGGTVTYALNFTLLSSASGSSLGPVTGRAFGDLGDCGTNGNYPLDGSMVIDGAALGFGFDVHAVDSSEGCGSVEYKVQIDLGTLSGPMSLYNARNDFSDTTTAQLGACPLSFESSAPSGRDAQGNK